jgi:hypothetical protein
MCDSSASTLGLGIIPQGLRPQCVHLSKFESHLRVETLEF